MTQFGVYRNATRNRDFAFLLQIQNTRLGGPGRVVMALGNVGFRTPSDNYLTPHLIVQGRRVYADPLNIATLPASRLGTLLEVLSDPDQDRIIRAIDEMISRV